MATTDVETVNRWLVSKHIHVPTDWLSACLTWLGQQRVQQGSEWTGRLVFDQWLSADLRELSFPVLPAHLAQVQKETLVGPIALQMDSIMDISQPAYSQLQKLRGKCNSNDRVASAPATFEAWEGKAERVLMLELTDGIQRIQAMEYQAVPILNTHLPPGTKLLILGEVECRLGVLLLTSENVKVLGGEVESLQASNSFGRMLCHLLGEEKLVVGEHTLTDDPIDAGEHTLTDDPIDAGEHTLTDNPSNSTRQTESMQDSLDDDSLDEDFPKDDLPVVSPHVSEGTSEQVFSSRPPSATTTFISEAPRATTSPANVAMKPKCQDSCANKVAKQGSPSRPSSPMDEPFDLEDDLCLEVFSPEDGTSHLESAGSNTMKSSILGTHTSEAVPFRNPQSKKPRLLGPELVAAFDSANSSPPSVLHLQDGTHISRGVTKQEQFPKGSKRENGATAGPKIISSFMPTGLGANRPLEQDPERNERTLIDCCNKDPFIYLSKALQPLKGGHPATMTVRIKGFIVTLLSCLKTEHDTWGMEVRVTDGSACLDVSLAPSLLRELIGLSVVEVMTLKKQPTTRAQADLRLKRFQQNLIDLSCFMDIEFNPGYACPLLVALEGPTRADVAALNIRAKKSYFGLVY
uniref:recQ-mediated genome instability protein 1 isoform X2 n=1 Tax=Myxine glutinosa TaxID=7769 RepID=UPI00358FF067